MTRLLKIVAMAGLVAVAVSAAPAASATPSEDAIRARLTDCLIVQEANSLGVPTNQIPATALSCFTYLQSIGRVPAALR